MLKEEFLAMDFKWKVYYLNTHKVHTIFKRR